jgi:putative ABC transport system permease protein
MLLLALRELMSRRTATLLAGAGLLTATLGFMVLASTSQTAEAILKGDLNRAWVAPYDLLIRPPDSQTPLESSQGLVRPNFLSSGNGGISLQQLSEIRQIPGVDVAAPIAILGYVYWSATLPIDISSIVQPGQELQAFRLRITASTDAGMSTIPFSVTPYQIVAPHGTLHAVSGSGGVGHLTNMTFPGGQIDCSTFSLTESCWAPSTECPGCQTGIARPFNVDSQAPGWIENFAQPLLVAAIDPEAEAKLTGLNSCVTQGSYLASAPLEIKPRDPTSVAPWSNAVIPALLSTSPFVDETFRVEVDQSSQASSLLSGGNPELLGGWTPVKSEEITAQEAYLGAGSGQALNSATTLFIRPGDVAYQQIGSDHLAATIQGQDLSIYQDPFIGLPLAEQVPPEALDQWFRPLMQVPWNNTSSNSHSSRAAWKSVGNFNPNCLPTFSDLGAGQLVTFAPPKVTLPNGHPLLPTRSAAGYVNVPPLLLTTLQAAQFFSDPIQYPGGLGDKFISAIRVRVADVETPGPASPARLSRVAAAIKEATGLAVDIVRGSSGRAIEVDLPAGKFGRPALTVTEPWAVKGIAFTFLRAVSAQNLGLFGLVLVGAMVLVGETGYISVRRRRREFGVLRALGWRASSVAWLVELEMLVLGLGTGLLALVAGIPIVSRLGMGTSAWQLAAVVPMAIAIAALAGLVPALSAGRGGAAAAMESTGRAAVTDRRPPNGLIGVAWLELRGQWRAEAALGAAAIALGAAILGVVVLISVAFRGQLDTTVLGMYLAGQVRPFHVVLAVLTLVVGAIAAAEVVTLSYLERRAHLGALRALGWPAWAVVRVLVTQATILGLTGGLASAAVVSAAGVLLQAPYAAIGWGLLAAIGMTFVATGIAVAAPLAHAYRANPADALRGE